jgi:hypothetical protein
MMHGLRLYFWWCIDNYVFLTKASYDDYIEHFSVSLRNYTPKPPKYWLGRRVWWCGVLILLLVLFMQEPGLLPRFGSWYAISKVYLDPLLASMSSWLWVLVMLLLELDQVLQVLALLLPRWLALHLLGAWHLLLACPAPPWCLACFLLWLVLV